jgi:hypothetical protein
LRARIDPTICGETCGSNSNRCGRFDEPGIHAAFIFSESQGSAPCKSSTGRIENQDTDCTNLVRIR